MIVIVFVVMMVVLWITNSIVIAIGAAAAVFGVISATMWLISMRVGRKAPQTTEEIVAYWNDPSRSGKDFSAAE